MLIIYIILALCLLIASFYDATQKKIPNWISLILIVSGLGWNFFSAEGIGSSDCVAGLVVGLLLMLPGYIFASMGAGDVKLMAAIGSVLGFDAILNVVLYTYIVIFVIAFSYITVKGDLLKFFRRYKVLVFGLFAGVWSYQKPDSSDAASQLLPLAPAIALATFYVLYLKICKFEFMVNLCHFQN